MDRLISEQAVLETIDIWVKSSEPYDGNGNLIPRHLYDRIKAIPSAKPQIGYWEEQEQIENLHREREQAYMQGYEDASKRFRQEPCDDAVSRQAVKDLFCRICMESNLCYRSKETCEDLKLFDKLPSVKPQEPQETKQPEISSYYGLRSYIRQERSEK